MGDMRIQKPATPPNPGITLPGRETQVGKAPFQKMVQQPVVEQAQGQRPEEAKTATEQPNVEQAKAQREKVLAFMNSNLTPPTSGEGNTKP